MKIHKFLARISFWSLILGKPPVWSDTRFLFFNSSQILHVGSKLLSKNFQNLWFRKIISALWTLPPPNFFYQNFHILSDFDYIYFVLNIFIWLLTFSQMGAPFSLPLKCDVFIYYPILILFCVKHLHLIVGWDLGQN